MDCTYPNEENGLLCNDVHLYLYTLPIQQSTRISVFRRTGQGMHVRHLRICRTESQMIAEELTRSTHTHTYLVVANVREHGQASKLWQFHFFFHFGSPRDEPDQTRPRPPVTYVLDFRFDQFLDNGWQ